MNVSHHRGLPLGLRLRPLHLPEHFKPSFNYLPHAALRTLDTVPRLTPTSDAMSRMDFFAFRSSMI
jgi:hypothetical protein